MNEKKDDEQRQNKRYGLKLDVFYKSADDASFWSGHGRTIDISSGGVLFVAEARVALGAAIELAIAWPASLDDHAQMQLVMRGRVVRSQSHGVAVQIASYEFRTRARTARGSVALPAI